MKAEATLFRIRYEDNSRTETEEFLNSRDFDWIAVEKDEKERYCEELMAASAGKKDFRFSEEKYFKVSKDHYTMNAMYLLITGEIYSCA